MKRLLTLTALLLMTIVSIADVASITLQDATNITQTKATLSAEFPNASNSHGFQYKYGTIPERTEFFKYAATATCDPLTFTQGSTAWRTIPRMGWVESPNDDASSTLNAEFSTTFSLTEATIISFDWQVNSETNIGVLSFYVDGMVVKSITGITDFETVSQNLSAGSHTLKWVYKRSTSENTGVGIGRVKNLNVQNTTQGDWIDVKATSSASVIENLYPSQDYIFRAYSKVDFETTYSEIKPFSTTNISIGNPTAITTQTTATLNCEINSGDAEVESGFVLLTQGKNVNREKLPKLSKSVTSDTSDPVVVVCDETKWKVEGNRMVSTEQEKDLSVSIFVYLSEPSTVRYSFSFTGVALTESTSTSKLYKHSQGYYSIDNGSQHSLIANTASSVGGNTVMLSEGVHEFKWVVEECYNMKISIGEFYITNGLFPVDTIQSTIIKPAGAKGMIFTQKEALSPATLYGAYSYMTPTYESPLEKKWSPERSSIVTFTTKNVTTKTGNVANLKQTSVTLNGNFDGGDATIVSKGIQYKNATATHWSDAKTVTVANTLTANVTNLSPETKYEWRTFIQAQDCETVYSDVSEFTTEAVKAVKPILASCTQHTAKILGEVIAGDAVVYARGMEFRAVGSSDWEKMEDFGADNKFIIYKTDLELNTAYEARTYVQQAGSKFVYSDILEFKTKNIELYVDNITDIYQRSAIVHGRIVRGDAISDNERIRIYKTTEKYSTKEKDAQYEFISNGDVNIIFYGEDFSQKIQLEPGYVYGVEVIATVNGKEISTGVPKLNVSTVNQNNPNFVASLTKSGSSQYCQVVNKDSYWTSSDGYVSCSRSSSTMGYNMPLTISFELKESATISYNWSVSGTKKYTLAQRTGVSGTRYGYLYSKLQCYVDGQLYESIASNDQSDKQSIEISLSAGIHTIEWRTSAYDDFKAKVYNLYIPRNAVQLLTDESKICFAPSFVDNLQTNNITQTTAQIQAEVVPTDESGVTYYFKKSENDIVESSVGNGVLTANLTGLIQNTDYTYHAVAKTSDGQEYFSDAITFKTSAVGVNISTGNVTQTTATVNVKTDAGTATISNMQYRLDNGEWRNLSNDKILLTDLVPNNSYTVYLQWTVGGSTYSNYISFKTSAVRIYPCSVTPEQTSALLKMGVFYTGTTTTTTSGIVFGGETYPLTSGELVRLTGLKPGTKYSYTYFVETKEGGRESGTGDFTTASVVTVTNPATNISNRSATLNGTITCDNYSGADFGFQWKTKQNWTTDPRFTKGRKGDDGIISVTLVNGMLNPDTEYQFRTAVRYGKNSEGTDIFYYGEWKDFRTENEFIIYPATPYTMYRTDSENNRLVLCGYYIAGSEDVVSQGYEYWRSGNASNSIDNIKLTMSGNDVTANNRQIITTDESMQGYIDLASLDEGTYTIRAFVTTTSSTYYGQQLTFTVGEPSAIESVDGDEPACMIMDSQIIVKNAVGVNVRIIDINGMTIYNKRCDNIVETFHVQSGIYIVKIENGKLFKVVVQ